MKKRASIAFVRKTLVILLVWSVFLFSHTAPCGFTQENEVIAPYAPVMAPMSLQDAILLAHINNKYIRINEHKVMEAKAGILEATSNFLPKVNINPSYTYNASVFDVSKSGLSLKRDPRVFSGYKNDLYLGASLDEVLLKGGANIGTYKQSRLEFKVAEETLRAVKLEIEFEAKRLYFGLLLAYETERIAKQMVDLAQAHYDEVKDKFKQGTVSRFDLLQSSVHVSKLVPPFIKAQNDVELIKAELRKLLGIKMNDEIALKDKDLTYTPIPIREKKFLRQAYANKPEMIMKLLGIDINKWGITVAKATMRPSVAVSMNYYNRSDELGNMFNARHNVWNVGAKVTIPIFDGFYTKAKVDQAKAKYAEAILEKEDVHDQIAVDVRKACLDLRQSRAIIKSQEDSVVEASDALRISEIGYDSGVMINLDVLDAQVSLGEVERNLVEAIYDYLMAEAYLDKIRGREFPIGRPNEVTAYDTTGEEDEEKVA